MKVSEICYEIICFKCVIRDRMSRFDFAAPDDESRSAAENVLFDRT